MSAHRAGLALIGALALGAALLGVRAPGPRGPALDEREAIRHQLAQAAGARSLSVAYFLSFASQPAAERVAASLKAGAFAVAPESGPPARPWRLSARARLPATVDAVFAAKEIVAGVALLNGGTYEGWEAVP